MKKSNKFSPEAVQERAVRMAQEQRMLPPTENCQSESANHVGGKWPLPGARISVWLDSPVSRCSQSRPSLTSITPKLTCFTSAEFVDA